MNDKYKQAEENLKLLYGDPKQLKKKTWKDKVKGIVTKFQPIRREEKLYSVKDIESEMRLRRREELEPVVNLKQRKKKGLIDCRLELDFGYEFKEKEIIIDVSVDGELFKFMSNRGSSEFTTYIGAAKRF